MFEPTTSLRKTEKENDLIEGIAALKQERKALILAHNYQRPEVQDIADITGDSLDLSLAAVKAREKVIVFCGVRFMAETAAILSPEKTVLLPIPEAGCALADAATVKQVRQERERHPGAVVVAYVNTSVGVKAESDICCTSANAIDIVRGIDQERLIIFVSDRNLGHYASHMVQRPVILWPGVCPTHAGLSVTDLNTAKMSHPGAQVMVHPECEPAILEMADRVAGTAGMLVYSREARAGSEFIVGTDIGMIHRLSKENPDKVFHPASDYLVCPTMKMTTLEDVKRSLETMRSIVTVEESVRVRARSALDAMLAVPTIPCS